MIVLHVCMMLRKTFISRYTQRNPIRWYIIMGVNTKGFALKGKSRLRDITTRNLATITFDVANQNVIFLQKTTCVGFVPGYTYLADDDMRILICQHDCDLNI